MPELNAPSLAEPLNTDIHAVLQAGGRGQRLSSIADGLPKPLIPVAGTPMIERLLRKIALTNIKRVTILTGWKGDMLKESVENMSLSPSPLVTNFVHEETPLGNIGGLGLLDGPRRPMLFAFADLVTEIDFSELIRIHQKSGADATLCSHIEEHQLSLGELKVDNESVVSYHEKPIKKSLICSGIAMLEPKVLDLIKPGQETGMVDLVNSAISAGLIVQHWEHRALWFDVNTPEALMDAERAITDQLSSE